MNTYVHYLCHNWRRYLGYCVLSVHSLIKRGGVMPSRIIVTMSDSLRSSPEAEILSGMGVIIESAGGDYISKFIALNMVFRKYRICNVVQLDCDCILTEDCNFMHRIELLQSDFQICAYKSNLNGLDEYNKRQRLMILGFNKFDDYWRLNAMAVALFGVCLARFENDMAGTGWVYGGMILVAREFTKTKSWKSMVAMSWITLCDETVIQLGRYAMDEFDFGYLEQTILPHRVDPVIFDLQNGPGIFHYAGDYYREHRPANRLAIASKLQKDFGITLVSDGPVGPKENSPWEGL